MEHLWRKLCVFKQNIFLFHTNFTCTMYHRSCHPEENQNYVPNVTQLHQAVVRLKVGSTKNQFGIKIKKWVCLQIPNFRIYDHTYVFFFIFYTYYLIVWSPGGHCQWCGIIINLWLIDNLVLETIATSTNFYSTIRTRFPNYFGEKFFKLLLHLFWKLIFKI